MNPNQLRALSEKNGWSIAGMLTAGGQAQLKLQADFSPNSGQYTVQFNVSGPSIPNGYNPVFTEALVTWIVEGNSVTRRISVANGTSITGSGQAVVVVMSDATQPIYNNPQPTSPAYQYNVSCQVVPGTRQTTEIGPVLYPIKGLLLNGNPGDTCYLQNTEITPGQYIEIPIPQDAGITSILTSVVGHVGLGVATTPPTIPEGTALVFVSLQGLQEMLVYDCATPFWYPLLSTAESVFVQNNNATAGTKYKFSVTFGIDG
jgi:hypothetical protein